MRKDRSKVEFIGKSFQGKDFALWSERSIRSLTQAQFRIKFLCEAYLAGEITLDEFKKELPLILDSRDREKRSYA